MTTDPNWKGNFDVQGGQVREDGTPVSGGGSAGTLRNLGITIVGGNVGANEWGNSDLDVVIVEATTPGIVVTLPSPVGKQGRVYTVKSRYNSTELVSVVSENGETIDGFSSDDLAQFQGRSYISDNTNYHRIWGPPF